MKYLCEESNLPCCSLLYTENSKYIQRSDLIFNTKLTNCSTTICLSIILICIINIRRSIQNRYSSIGRNEMLTFLGIYFFAILLEIINATSITSLLPKNLKSIFISIQLTLASISILSLNVGIPISIWNQKNEHVMKAITITKIICGILSIIIASAYYYAFTTKNIIVIFVLMFPINSLFIFIYAIYQFIRVKSFSNEIWAYGTLSISAFFFSLAITSLFISSKYCLLTDRYLDGIFFFHIFSFAAIVMIHKYWLSMYHDTLESIYVKIGVNNNPGKKLLENDNTES